MATKRTKLGVLWLGERLGDICEKLAVSGHDKSIIVIGVNGKGGTRIIGDFENVLTTYGAVSLAQNELYMQMTNNEINREGKI